MSDLEESDKKKKRKKMMIAAVSAATFFVDQYTEEPVNRQQPKYFFNRIDWQEHVLMLCHTAEFQRRYRMTEELFDKLLEILCPELVQS